MIVATLGVRRARTSLLHRDRRRSRPAVAFWAWLKEPAQRERLDRWMLQLPGIGPIAQKFSTSQAARTLATLLGGGIPLVNAIDVAARSIENQYMAHELQIAGQQVREGRALAAAMHDSGAFPDVAIKMVEVGESTGALQEMLNSLADFYDEEIDTNLGALRHARRAGPAGHHGHRHRRAAAGAVHAALQSRRLS